MKKLLLAPAVAVVAGSMTFAGTSAFANTTPSAPESTPAESAPSEEAPAEDITVEGKDSYTVAELDEGITLTVKGLKPGQEVEGSINATVEPRALGKGTADENGIAKVKFATNCADTVAPEDCFDAPEFGLSFSVDGERLEEFEGLQSIKVSDAKKSVKLDKDSVSVDELTSKETAPVFSGTGLEPKTKYAASLFALDDPNAVEAVAEVSFTTDDEGNFSVPLVVSEEDAKKLSGEVEVRVFSPEGGIRILPLVSFKVTKASEKPSETPKPTEDPTDAPSDDPSDEAAKYALEVSPKEITPADFVNKDKGVNLTVTGLEPGEEFSYSVVQKAGDGLKLERTVKADKNGTWNFTVYGSTTGSDLSGFLGTYEVTVKSDQGELKDSFTVTNTPGKKGDKNDDAEAGNKGSVDSSNNLPRTGMELSGLIAGGVLLTVGAATVLVTRRRTK